MKIYKKKSFSSHFKQKNVLQFLVQNKSWKQTESEHVQVQYSCDDNLVLDIFFDTHAFHCRYAIENKNNDDFFMERYTQALESYSGLFYKSCNIFISTIFKVQSSQFDNIEYTLRIVDEWNDTTYVKCEKKVLSAEPQKYLEISCDINEDQIEFAKKSINCKFDYIQFLLD